MARQPAITIPKALQLKINIKKKSSLPRQGAFKLSKNQPKQDFFDSLRYAQVRTLRLKHLYIKQLIKIKICVKLFMLHKFYTSRNAVVFLLLVKTQLYSTVFFWSIFEFVQQQSEFAFFVRSFGYAFFYFKVIL